MTTNRLSLFIVMGTIAAFAVLTVSMLGPARHVSSGTGYDQVERIRAQRYAVDTASGYDQVELIRAQRYAVDTASGYDQVELIRAQRYAAAVQGP